MLFFRRTTTLGALILVAVLSNVVAINYFYDVPVKLFSSMLLLMDFFLLAPDTRRLTDIFILNKPTLPLVPEFTWNKRRSIRLAAAIKWIFLLGCFYGTISSMIKSQTVYGDLRPLPKYYGIYNVQTFIRNTDTIPPLLTDTVIWKQMIIQREGYASFIYMNDKRKNMRFSLDSTLHKAIIFPVEDSSVRSIFTIKSLDTTQIVMAGKLNTDSLQIIYKKVDLNSFLLLSRGFHWINEYPFNR